jgi:aspartyl/asparaginyl beta-hydroxylase (cupin superfamily)
MTVWLQGKKQAAFAEACPGTAELLNSIPTLMTDIPMAYSFFSTLHSKSEIAPHTAACNLRLRCHMPLIVPNSSSSSSSSSRNSSSSDDVDACGIRVGEEVRPWIEGKAMLFDDAYEHEVWNHTDQERVVSAVIALLYTV